MTKEQTPVVLKRRLNIPQFKTLTLYIHVAFLLFFISAVSTYGQTANCKPDFTIPLNSSGVAAISVSDIDDGTSTNTLSIDITNFNCTDAGNSVVVTLTSTLGASSVTCFTTVTILDNDAPTISAPGTVTTTTNSGCTATGVSLGTATGSDNCGSVSFTNDAPASFSIGNTTVTWTANDGNGNTTTATQTVTVTDDDAPTISAPGTVTTTTNSGCTATGVSLGTATGSDNCGSVSFTNDAPASFSIGNTTVTWTANDGNGNTTTATQTVTVTDDDAPTISVPGTVTTTTNSGCTATGVSLGTATGSDNCGSVSFTNDAPASFSIGNTTVTWTANDGNGNTTTATQTVTVTDDDAPTISAPGTVTTTTNSGCTATGVSLGTATGSDNCGSVSFTNDAPASFSIGNTTVTWTANDGNGNTTTATQTVTVTDDDAPTISVPGTVTTTTNSGCTATGVSLGTATGSDNCGSVSFTNDAPASFSIGNTTVTWTANDGNGNTTTATQTVTVTDDDAPTISAPGTVTTTTNSGCTATGVSLGTATGSDNCGSVSFTNDAPASFSIGNTTVTWTANDGNGNTTTATQTVTVADDDAPTITCPTLPAFYNTDSNVCDYTVLAIANIDPTITNDNCGIASVINNYNNTNTLVGAVFPLGTTTVEWTITDTSGNTENCSYDVVVVDNQAPIISTCPSNISVNTDVGNCTALVSWSLPVVTDNCPSTLVWTSTHNASGDTFGIGVTTVTHTITDGAGNEVECTFTITVTDNEPPATTALPDLTAQCSITMTPPTVTDNCGGTITGTTGQALTISAQGLTVVNWLFSDGTNSVSVPQNVIIEDTLAPVVPTLNPVVYNAQCEISSIAGLTIPEATDNCDGTVQGTLDPTFEFPWIFSGTQDLEWHYIDSNGLESTQIQQITLNPPTIAGGTIEGTNNGTAFNVSTTVSSCSGDIPIDFELTGKAGTIVQWEKKEAKASEDDEFWETIIHTNSNYTALFVDGSMVTTDFRVLVQAGNCTEYSTIINVTALPEGDPPTISVDNNVICLGENVELTAISTYLATSEGLPDANGDFNQGQLNTNDPTSWLIDGEIGGFTAGGNNTKPRNWSATNNHTWNGISYDSEEFKFAISYGNFDSSQYSNRYGDPSTMETPIFSLANSESATLDFDQAYYFIGADIALIEITTNGNATNPTYVTLRDMNDGAADPKKWFDITNDIHSSNNKGSSSATNYLFKDDNTSIPIPAAYIGAGNENLRIRFTFRGHSNSSIWALDNLALNKVEELSNEIEITDGIGDPNEDPIVEGTYTADFSFEPEAPGVHRYGATSLINGCRAYDPLGTAIETINVNYSYAGSDIDLSGECGENTIQLNAYDNRLTANENATKGAFTLPTDCVNCDDLGTMEEGVWSLDVTSSCGGGSFSDNTDPDAIFTAEAGTYVLHWTVAGCTSIMNVVITNCMTVDFDGTKDYVDFGKDDYHLNGAFSLEVWVKPESFSGQDKTILSKRASDSSTKGYDLSVDTGGIVSFNWNESGSITSPYPIGTDRWYHIAIVHSGSQYSLYIDGVRVALTGGATPVSNDYRCILGAMDRGSSTQKPKRYFNGWIDELRIWDVELTVEQIHQNMNQEIRPNPADNSQVFGEVVLIEVHGLAWADLVGYYRMDDFECGDLQPNFNVGLNVSGKLKNITSSETQNAPLPYTSRVNNQTWTTDSTWTNYQVWDPPNSLGVDNATMIDWNIVQVDHNIRGNKDITVLGLFSNNGELTINNTTSENEDNSGHMLWVTHYLKLDGAIDLVGESQLLQKPYWDAQYYESMLDETSTGAIERDQQGIMNSYAYNYWSSPVSLQGTGNNNPVAIGEILKDGTISNSPKTINWGANSDPFFADGGISSPVKVASRWIWKFSKNNSDYANWEFIGNDTPIGPTEGYTMKGVDIGGSLDLSAEHQNYVYNGKPNNVPFGIAGEPLIHTTFTAPANTSIPAAISLTGNPFPSALDADMFLLDNQNSTDGTLYFWEHWSDNTHQWALYQGGYAIRKVNNAVPAVTHPSVSTGGGSRSTPGKYIPVGQGFYVIGNSSTSGPVVFKNSQRFFHRETENGGSNSTFIRGTNKKNKSEERPEFVPDDEIMRIRLGLESPEGFHRQILAAFFEGATDGIDPLYDGRSGDFLRNDGFFLQDDKYFVIQAFGEFDREREIPISITIDEKFSGGTQKFMIDRLENIPDNVEVYIKDYHNDGETYDIRNSSSFEISLEAGEHKDRFALVFQSRLATLKEVATIDDGVTIFMNNSLNEMVVQKTAELEFKQITLFNSLGQSIRTWNKGIEDRYINLPAGKVSTGVYILKIDTEQGVISKKLLIE